MKQRLFTFAIFFMLTTVGCSSTAERTKAEKQGYERLSAEVTGTEEYPGANAAKRTPGTTNTTGGAAITADVTGTTTGAVGTTGTEAGGEIVLLNIKTRVPQGDKGSLSIQGKPDITYIATAVYEHSGKIITATAAKRAGADGIASWSWDVSKDTVPGTYRVMITGGGKLLTTAYTVTR